MEPQLARVGARQSTPVVLGYGTMIALTALAMFAIRSFGKKLTAPAAGGGFAAQVAGSDGKIEVFLHVLMVLLAIMVVSQVFAWLFGLIGQPAVLGEMVAGIVLGPSLLGRVAPQLFEFLLPRAVMPALNVISGLGVLLFMFLVGVELDIGAIRERKHSMVAISHASIIAPLLLGGAAALWLYPRLSNSSVPFEVFALFMGVSMSITAFPVLARILSHYGMQTTPLGSLAMGCAAVDDVTAWCLLAVVVSAAHNEPTMAAMTLGLALVFVFVVFVFLMPLVGRATRAADRKGELSRSAVPIALAGLVLSAVSTEAIGIHAIFGAFVAGVAIPHDSLLAGELGQRIRVLVTSMLLPVFFACTGMRTELGLVSGLENWSICVGIIALACAGKFGGSAIAASMLGVGWRDAVTLGALMNTRGLMELVALNVGLDLHIISPTLFTMMVIMAVVTTFLTSPIVALIRGSSQSAARQAHEPELVT